tara:strand:- start:141 stop:599 length:459 start_codon:yes stop_codon:yes gene_type:complete
MNWLDTIREHLDYNWLRAAHILSVIAWMAGLLMLPRLIIYRLEGEGNPGLVEAMDKAALRLQKIILSPAMHMTWLFGGLLIWQNWQSIHHQPAFWFKIVMVVGLTIVHFYFTRLRKAVIAQPSYISSKKLRLINETPFVIAIMVVIAAVVYI